MSADKLTESDSLPDRSSGIEDKPFPGAPEDREPAPEPTNSRSMDDVRAAHQKAGNNAEFEAMAKAGAPTAGSSDSPGSVDSGSPDSGFSGEGPTEVGGDGEGTVPGARPGVQGEGTDDAAVPGTDTPGGREPEGPAQADGFARPEEFTRPDRAEELPPFPGAPEDREPAPEPTNSRSMDDVRAAHQKAGNNAEFEAMAAEDAAAAKEASASRPGDTTAVRDVGSRDPVADESGEQQGEEPDSAAADETAPEQPAPRMPQPDMPAAETPDGEPTPLDSGQPDTSLDGQQTAVRPEEAVVPDQVEDAEAEPAPEGVEPAKDGVVTTRSDGTTPEADDRPVVEGSVEPDRPEAVPALEEGDAGDTNATRSEVRLDTQSDDQRPVTRAEMMAMVAEMTAVNNAKLDAVKAEKAELEQKVNELYAKLELLQGSSDRRSDSNDSAESSDTSEIAQTVADEDTDGEADHEDATSPDSSETDQTAEKAESGSEEGTEASPDGNGQPPDDGAPPEGSDGSHFTWTSLPPEGRTVGDTSPTGIGLKPEGEQLRETDAKTSRLDALRKTVYESETIENVHDAVDEYADPLQKLFGHPPTSPHADVPVNHPVYAPADHEHAAANDMVMAAFVVSLVGVEGARATRHAVHNLKEKTHDWIGRHQHAGD